MLNKSEIAILTIAVSIGSQNYFKMKQCRHFMQITYSPNNVLITMSCRLRGGCERLREKTPYAFGAKSPPGTTISWQALLPHDFFTRLPWATAKRQPTSRRVGVGCRFAVADLRSCFSLRPARGGSGRPD